MCIRDRLRIGSSNLNNRSLGFDSECDVAIEADADDPADAELRAKITGFRVRLLSEHLDVTADEFDAAVRERESLLGAVEAMRSPGRTLEEFDRETIDDEESVIAENELVDPEDARTPTLERVYRSVLRRAGGRRSRH